MSTAPAPVSPDGRWWWDGTAWRPMPQRPKGSGRVWWWVVGGCLAALLLALLGGGVLAFFTWQAIQSTSGSVAPTAGTQGEVPAGFPSEFPTYPGASVETGSVSGRTYHVTYQTSDPVASACSFYRSALAESPWRVQASVEVPLIGSNCVYGFTNQDAGLSGSVSVVNAGGRRTAIVVTLTTRSGSG